MKKALSVSILLAFLLTGCTNIISAIKNNLGNSSNNNNSSSISSNNSNDSSSGTSSSQSGSSSSSSSQSEIASTVTIGELYELNLETNKWELEGKLVKVEHLALQGRYGNTYIGGGTVGYYIADLRGVEIQVKEAPKFERNFGYGADITAEGRVVDVNGRLTLQEAKITVNSERPESGKYEEGAGLQIYSCPPSATTRETLDNTLSGRIYSGILVEGVYQLASVPAAINVNSPTSSFSVVFPGEDLDLTDPENHAPLTIHIPAGSELTEGAITAFNTFFAGKAIGDFATICTNLQYDTETYGGMGMVIETFWSQKGLEEVADKDKPVFYTSWSEIMESQNQHYVDAFVDLKPANQSDPLNFPYSFTVDESYLNAPKAYWQEDYVSQIIKIGDADLKKCASTVVTANLKPAKKETYLEAVEAKLKATGYVEDETMAEDGLYIFTLSESEVVKKEVVLMSKSDYQFAFQYIAPKNSIDYETFSEFISDFESIASAKISNLAGSSFIHHSALVDFSEGKKPSNINLSWKNEDMFDSLISSNTYLPLYGVEFTFDSIESAADGLSDYKSNLEAAGFAMKILDLTSIGYPLLFGYFNSTSNEYIILSQNEETIFADLLVLNSVAVTSFVKNMPQSDAELSAMYLAAYISCGLAQGPSKLPSSFTLGTNAAVFWNMGLDYTYYSTFGICMVYLELRYDVQLTNELVTNYSNKLENAGFVEASIDTTPYGGELKGNGYWNESSSEFVLVSFEDNILTILSYIIYPEFASYFINVA